MTSGHLNSTSDRQKQVWTLTSTMTQVNSSIYFFSTPNFRSSDQIMTISHFRKWTTIKESIYDFGNPSTLLCTCWDPTTKTSVSKITLQSWFLARSENFLQLWGMRSRTGNVPSSLTLLLHNIYSKSHHKSARCRSLSHVLSFVTPTVVKEIFTTVKPTYLFPTLSLLNFEPRGHHFVVVLA